MEPAEAGKNMDGTDIYVGNYNGTLLPGGLGVVSIWDLTKFGRRFFVKSVTWSISCRTANVPFLVIPVEDNEVLFYQLAFGEPALVGAHIGYHFEPRVAPPPSLADSRILIYKPGQYFYDGVYFSGSLSVWLVFQNYDLVNSLDVITSVAVEIKEEEKP